MIFFFFLDLSQKNPFYSILPEATLLSAVEEFSYGIHRGKLYYVYTQLIKFFVYKVCVLNPDGSIKGILSQSTVAKYFYTNQHHFPDVECIMNKTVSNKTVSVCYVKRIN